MPFLQLTLLETSSCCVPYQVRIDDEKPEFPLGVGYREQAADLSLHLLPIHIIARLEFRASSRSTIRREARRTSCYAFVYFAFLVVEQFNTVD
jgi:hypothetical protein